MYFGEFLVVNNIITKEQLDEGLHFQKITRNLLGETLLEMAYIDKETLEKFLEMHLVTCIDKILHENVFSDCDGYDQGSSDPMNKGGRQEF